ncbi:apolipoprotein A-IV [Pyrgilauda ruficollis]|uniref:apolipoprotein A-IV n=1 Tax=Pyrgilauda ruficollis TaxID=221976 RepID=UPI001B85C0C1|nr:apolipoprotein A-IV [Pyrgilauda ruficollis]
MASRLCTASCVPRLHHSPPRARVLPGPARPVAELGGLCSIPSPRVLSRCHPSHNHTRQVLPCQSHCRSHRALRGPQPRSLSPGGARGVLCTPTPSVPVTPRGLAGPWVMPGLWVMSGPSTRQALPRCARAKVQALAVSQPAWKRSGCINRAGSCRLCSYRGTGSTGEGCRGCREPGGSREGARGEPGGSPALHGLWLGAAGPWSFLHLSLLPQESPALRMAPKAAALVLVLLAISGSRADVNPDEVASVIWKYFTELGSNAKDTVEQLHQTELSKQLNTLLKSNLQSVSAYAEDLQERLVPFAVDMQARLAQDSQRLKEQIRRELQELQAKLAPYADEVHQQIGTNIRQLQAKMSPYAEELRSQVDRSAGELKRALEPYAAELRERLQDNAESIQASLSPYADRLQQQIDGGVESVKQRLAPVADELKAQVEQSVAELRKGLSPYAQEVQDGLNRQLDSLTVQMERVAEELRSRLAASSEELRAQLSPLARELREAASGDAESLRQRLQPLAQQLEQRVGQTLETFRQQAAPFGETFGKQLVQRLEEMRGKLDSGAAGVEDHLELLEKEVREKVAAFLSTAAPPQN